MPDRLQTSRAVQESWLMYSFSCSLNFIVSPRDPLFSAIIQDVRQKGKCRFPKMSIDSSENILKQPLPP